MRCSTPDAYRLIHQGAVALAGVEANGFAIDVPLMNKTIKEVGDKIERYNNRLKTHEIWKEWKKIYGRDANLTSRDQLGDIVFKRLKLAENEEVTDTGKMKMNADVLSDVGHPFIKRFLELEN